MNNDHEIAFMYASNPWGIFQPRTNIYSPFNNVVLRVVRPARPSLEDLVLQLLASENASTQQTDTQIEPPVQTENPQSDAANTTPNYELSERIARGMQEQEDREQEMRDRAAALSNQIGEFMTSLFGSSGSANVPHVFRERQVNAEAGPSTIKKSVLNSASGSSLGTRHLAYSPVPPEEDGPTPDDSDKKSGKKRARTTQFNPTNYSSSELLDNLEAALRHEVNRFDFPEQLEFLEGHVSPEGTPPMPMLLHTPSNASVYTFEKALLDLQVNLDLIRDNQDNSVTERRSQLGGRIRRELEDLDRRVLEAWAAKRRRYSPVSSSSFA